MKRNDEIIFENVCFAYKKNTILDNVILSIKKGEFASIVGPNGGGKTTLLKLILGLIKPDSGNILVLGNVPGQTREKVGYMPQYAHLDMNFPATVKDVVLMGRLSKKRFWFSKNDRIKAIESIEEMKMTAYINTGFNELSGGQKQRVLIARALCSNPEILLLDEPVAGMNQEETEDTARFILDIHEETDTTILMIDHDMGFVMDICEKILVLNFGCKIADGTPHEIQSNSDVIAAYLGNES